METMILFIVLAVLVGAEFALVIALVYTCYQIGFAIGALFRG